MYSGRRFDDEQRGTSELGGSAISFLNHHTFFWMTNPSRAAVQIPGLFQVATLGNACAPVTLICQTQMHLFPDSRKEGLWHSLGAMQMQIAGGKTSCRFLLAFV